VIIEQDIERYYVASVPALRGCHTQAKSLDELMMRVSEAVESVESSPSSASRGFPRLPRIADREVIAALRKAGFDSKSSSAIRLPTLSF
jgi:predicted RNase H-like HicB family nuclease